MPPILILQHLSSDGPAYLGTWLRRNGVPYVVLDTEAGDEFPQHIEGYGALAVMGGEMSANDRLPSLRRAEALILEAMAQGRPVIGHCLGGQLMARALGVPVVASIAPEVGWQALTLSEHGAARDWFGDAEPPHVFQWHEEAFGLPADAVPLASSDACAYQAFAIGPHLAMQFHVEVDEEKLRRWATLDSTHYLGLQQRFGTVQSGRAMCESLDQRLSAQQALADRIYARWLRSVVSCA